MAYSSVGSFGTVGETPPECPAPTVPVAEPGEGPLCACPPATRPPQEHLGEDMDAVCVPRTCDDFDADNSSPCKDKSGTFPEKWFYRPKGICTRAPATSPPAPAEGAPQSEISRHKRNLSQSAHYVKLNCDGASQGALGTKLMIGGAVVFGGVLVGSLLAR